MTLVDDLRQAAAERPLSPVVCDEHERLNSAELWDRASCLAGGLLDAGVQRGDRVAVLLGSSVDAAAAVYGTALAGAAFVVVDAAVPPVRLERLLSACGVSRAISTTGCGLPIPSLPVGELLAARPAAEGRVTDEDLAAVICTSGSTGEPRGAAFLHRSVSFTTAAVQRSLELAATDRVLSLLSLSHTYGLYQLLLAVRAGATLHLRPGNTPPGRWLEVLHDQQITVLPGVPTLWQLLLTLGGNRPLPALRLLTNAGAALPPPLLARLRTAFPEAGVLEMYGQTECARVCFLPADQVDRHPESVGYPLPGTRAWVVGADDAELPAGAVGELLVKGDHVMEGYWGDPAATARKLRPDGVMRTGDLFRRDAEGRLSFIARLDDIITTRGEKVAPLEVERVLCKAPGVREAAVVGAPDDRLGECVVAHVAPQPGQTLDALALRRFCSRYLEFAKVPGRVQLHQDLPRLPGGKVDRLALRALSG